MASLSSPLQSSLFVPCSLCLYLLVFVYTFFSLFIPFFSVYTFFSLSIPFSLSPFIQLFDYLSNFYRASLFSLEKFRVFYKRYMNLTTGEFHELETTRTQQKYSPIPSEHQFNYVMVLLRSILGKKLSSPKL